MDEVTTPAGREDDLDALVPGSTARLTPEGWERIEYMEPGDDWSLQDDGSYLAPDGRTRTWLLTSTPES